MLRNTFKQPFQKKIIFEVQGSQKCHRKKRKGKENLNPSWFQQGRNFPTYRGISHGARESQRPQHETGAPWIYRLREPRQVLIFHSTWAADLQLRPNHKCLYVSQTGIGWIRNVFSNHVNKEISFSNHLPQRALKFWIRIITLFLKNNYDISLKV